MLVSPAMGPAVSRSSMEVMLDSIRQRDEKPKDLMPTLPARPVSKGRLPSSRLLAVKSKIGGNFPPEQEMLMGAERMEEEKNVLKIGTFAGKEMGKAEQPEESPYAEMPRLVSYEEAEFKDLAKSGSSSPPDARSGETIDYALIKGTNKEHAHLQPTVLEELERRVLKAETALSQKEEENLTLKQQLSQKEEENLTLKQQVSQEEENRILKQQVSQKEKENLTLKQQLLQHESRWSDYEVKMKSMEEMWQKQLTSLQMSLAAAKKSLAADVSPNGHLLDSEKTSGEFQTPESTPAKQPHGSGAILPRNSDFTGNHIHEMVNEFAQKRQVFEDDARRLAEAKTGQLVHGINSDEELQKLKTNFAVWKKDYKIKLRETKVKLQKHGNSESVKSHKKWWIMRITKQLF